MGNDWGNHQATLLKAASVDKAIEWNHVRTELTVVSIDSQSVLIIVPVGQAHCGSYKGYKGRVV